jgi:hypothetical protein
MSSNTPQHSEPTPIQLAAIARESWRLREVRQDNILPLMCEARSGLAHALGVALDPDQDVCRFCDPVDPESQGIEAAARVALDLIGRAVADHMASDDLLSHYVEATSRHIDALSRTR